MLPQPSCKSIEFRALPEPLRQQAPLIIQTVPMHGAGTTSGCLSDRSRWFLGSVVCWLGYAFTARQLPAGGNLSDFRAVLYRAEGSFYDFLDGRHVILLIISCIRGVGRHNVLDDGRQNNVCSPARSVISPLLSDGSHTSLGLRDENLCSSCQ